MRLPSPIVFFMTIIIAVCGWIFTPTPNVIALTQVRLFDLSYHECPPEIGQGAVTSGRNTMAANCFIVTGKAENSTNQTVYDADIFGRIYDANNNPTMQNRNRLGSIPEVPPGIHDFDLRISVPANQPTPLKFKRFKASGFKSSVRPKNLYLNLEAEH